MKIGSHNSWSFLRPTKWWMKLLTWAARCQTENIFAQHEFYNVDLFDLRVRFDKSGRLIIAHGLVEFQTYTIVSDLTEMNNWGKSKNIYCRVMLEFNRVPKDLERQVKYFEAFRKTIKKNFPNIIFFGFKLKCTGVKMLNDETPEPALDGKYSSTCSKWRYKYNLPIIYALLKNKKNKKQGTDLEWLHLDFVEY